MANLHLFIFIFVFVFFTQIFKLITFKLSNLKNLRLNTLNLHYLKFDNVFLFIFGALNDIKTLTSFFAATKSKTRV